MSISKSPSKVLSELGFSKLSHGVHLYASDTTAEGPGQSSSPSMVILCAWMFAQPRHIAKYTVGYQSLFPNSDILLVQNELSNMIWRPDSFQEAHFKPAAMAIERHIAANATSSLLLHAFSNGGGHAAVQTAEVYHRLTGKDVPLRAVVLDSTPGTPGLQITVSAVVQGMPKSPAVRAVGTACTYGVISMCGLFHNLGVAELAAVKMFRQLNSTAGPFLVSGGTAIPRVYIFSETDVMTPSGDVVRHAAEAREKFTMEKDAKADLIQLEEFVGTPHVNHMGADQERYWKIVERTWLSRPAV